MIDIKMQVYIITKDVILTPGDLGLLEQVMRLGVCHQVWRLLFILYYWGIIGIIQKTKNMRETIWYKNVEPFDPEWLWVNKLEYSWFYK